MITMEKRITGISRDLIIHPGETIADVLEDRGITQTELAIRTGVSPAYISNIISGKKDISTRFAMSLEYALGVSKSFWLNLQANYNAELLELNEEQTITEGEKKVYQEIPEVVTYLKGRNMIPSKSNVEEGVLFLRKFLQISNIEKLNELVPVGAFRIDTKTKINPYVLGAWLQLCQTFEKANIVSSHFNKEQINTLVSDIKKVMIKPESDIQKELSHVMGQYGISFSVVPNFRGAPVHGYISQEENGIYHMVLTIRRAFADIFWFSLFHEIGHIVNGDILKGTKFVDASHSQDIRREQAADLFASNALLEPGSYKSFLCIGDFSINAITRYAKTQNVMPYIVIGRLQKEKHIPYTWYSKYKLRYKWADR